MISRPPKTDDTSLNVWTREVQSEFNNYIQTLQVPVSKSGIIGNYAHGKHPTKPLTSGESAYFGFTVPHSLREFKEVTIRYIPTTTGTMSYTVNVSYGGVGEDENQNTATLSAVGVSVTDDQIMEINLSTPTDLFAAVDIDDEVGIELKIDSFTTTTDIQVMRLYVKYI